jgi:NADH-quinone oxidoreductase subunit G
MVTFVVNGKEVTAPKGTMIVDAAKQAGVDIPIFCYEPRLGSPIGACRMCLVEVEGMRGLQTGCSTPIAPDMVVNTTTDDVKEAQDGVL